MKCFVICLVLSLLAISTAATEGMKCFECQYVSAGPAKFGDESCEKAPTKQSSCPSADSQCVKVYAKGKDVAYVFRGCLPSSIACADSPLGSAFKVGIDMTNVCCSTPLCNKATPSVYSTSLLLIMATIAAITSRFF